jgi:hypothetical protein
MTSQRQSEKATSPTKWAMTSPVIRLESHRNELCFPYVVAGTKRITIIGQVTKQQWQLELTEALAGTEWEIQWYDVIQQYPSCLADVLHRTKEIAR